MKGERQVESARGKLKKEKWGKKQRHTKTATSDDEPLRRCCTTMPLIALSLVCGHSDQRSCIDNPTKGVWCNSAKIIIIIKIYRNASNSGQRSTRTGIGTGKKVGKACEWTAKHSQTHTERGRE